MLLADMDVAERRQALNEAAYFDVLRAFLNRGTSALALAGRLRKELNISNAQHKSWYEELRGAMGRGQLATASIGIGNAAGAAHVNHAAATHRPGVAAGGISKASGGGKAAGGGSRSKAGGGTSAPKRSKVAVVQVAAQTHSKNYAFEVSWMGVPA
jgi:hypothetical protein